MAVIKCPKCGKENLSDSAEICPECGYGIKAHFNKIYKSDKQTKTQNVKLIEKSIDTNTLYTDKMHIKRRFFSGDYNKQTILIVSILCALFVVLSLNIAIAVFLIHDKSNTEHTSPETTSLHTVLNDDNEKTAQTYTLQDKILGWWLYCDDVNDFTSREHAYNIQFKEDKTFYLQTWRTKAYGTYEIYEPNIIIVQYEKYVNWAGRPFYELGDTVSDKYYFDGKNIYELSAQNQKETYQHMPKLMTSYDIERTLADNPNFTSSSSEPDNSEEKYFKRVLDSNGILIEIPHPGIKTSIDISYSKKYTNYCCLHWLMYFQGLTDYTPIYNRPKTENDSDYVELYHDNNASLDIYRYKIGSTFYLSNITTPEEYILDYLNMMKHLSNEGDGYGGYFEVLNQSDTYVDSIPAKQVTLRFLEYMDNMGNQINSTTIQCTAFQYNNSIYAIIAREDIDFITNGFTDSFHDILDTVKKSISFNI